ncbi:MAG TPA: heavy metal translocating P-type ATPase metal-binding domain-containing protein, partial [Polyangiales bacterium]|nr:heavy metal translocating P-type ATPase metal-binding domain-containing protein [Polyangiales bacterium]
MEAATTTPSLAAPAAPALLASICAHCGNALPSTSRDEYCCNGCRAVHGLLAQAGLLRYYDLRDTRVEAARDPATERSDHTWLEPIAATLASSPSISALSFKLQGLHCAACVWLIEQLFARHPGASRVLVNPGQGTVELCVSKAFPLLAFAAELESFGYKLGELGTQTDDDTEREHELLLRTAVCMALGGNAMMFAAAIYLGLHEGALYR